MSYRPGIVRRAAVLLPALCMAGPLLAADILIEIYTKQRPDGLAACVH